MPKITVDGKTGEFAAGKRLVNAIKELGVNIGHRCGGQGRCTTCRVTFSEGEPAEMTQAEYDKLIEKDLYGEARLSCQLNCSQDMSMNAVMTLESVEGWIDTGPQPVDEIEPDPQMLSQEQLARHG